ncbi:MAG: hypothetical protein VKN17_04640 [Cyanobacteriota bacterium]|jgi:hypothetical protein|nr:hypothetical protein [Synechococcus sp. FGCU3]MEB3105051.1 hypothetical protein [Cyanobacteriota bacterium]
MAFSKLSLSAALVAAPLIGAALLGQPALAQQQGYGQTLGTGQQEREINFGSGPNRSSGGILDSTNPIDLMNKLRRGTAMDDATPPGDAIDAALNDYHHQAGGSTATKPGSPSSLVKPVQ